MYGKSFKLSSALSLILCLATTPVHAFISTPYGWYLDLFVGATKISNSDLPGDESSSGIGGGGSLGFKFMPYFAAEIGVTRYTNSTIKDGLGVTAATAKRYSVDIAAKGILPFYDTGFEAFGKLGIGRIYNRVSIDNSTAARNVGISNSSHSSNGVYVGLGAQYFFMPEFSVIGQWARQQGDSATGTADLFSIGLSYIFD